MSNRNLLSYFNKIIKKEEIKKDEKINYMSKVKEEGINEIINKREINNIKSEKYDINKVVKTFGKENKLAGRQQIILTDDDEPEEIIRLYNNTDSNISFSDIALEEIEEIKEEKKEI